MLPYLYITSAAYFRLVCLNSKICRSFMSYFGFWVSFNLLFHFSWFLNVRNKETCIQKQTLTMRVMYGITLLLFDNKRLNSSSSRMHVQVFQFFTSTWSNGMDLYAKIILYCIIPSYFIISYLDIPGEVTIQPKMVF